MLGLIGVGQFFMLCVFVVVVSQMKVICWNVQGAKKHQLREEIKILNCKFDPDILILLETMTNKINTDKIISILGYEHFDCPP